jgi:hypothetical protein
MSFIHRVDYDRGTLFPVEQRAAVTPNQIRQWMNKKAFGVRNPGPEARSTKCRSATLDVMKKAVSWYMPNRAAWDCIRCSGNPTRSRDVNEVIKAVKKLQVRRRGKASQTKRAMTQEEFRNLLTFFSAKSDFQHRYRYTTMVKYQYHLIARCDDLANFRLRDLHAHSDPRFSSFAIQTRVHWSKNVRDERDCPNQIFLGSFDTTHCLLLALSVYLETWLSSGTTSTTDTVLLFGDGDGEATVDRIKVNFSAALRRYFNTNIAPDTRSDLGTHSLRKFASTFAHNNGCSMDEIDCRGRWNRNSRRTVDVYVDVVQAFVDAKVQGVLAVGGPIRYSLVADCGVTKAWLDRHVVPGLRRYFGVNDGLPDILSLPLLFACLDDELSVSLVPLTLVTRVRAAYALIRTLDVNPVTRIHLHIQRVQDQLAIYDVAPLLDAEGNPIVMVNQHTQQQQDGNFLSQQNIDNMNAIMIQMQQLKQQATVHFDTLHNLIDSLRVEMNEKHVITNRNLSRIMIQPSRRATQEQAANNNTINENEVERNAIATILERGDKIAELMSAPRTLYDLWIEYEMGTGNRKAAKDFTYNERGRCRFKYCRRKVVWDCISKHVNAGFTAMTAVDKIYECYGRGETVTSIIKKMTNDKKTGGHPSLHV